VLVPVAAKVQPAAAVVAGLIGTRYARTMGAGMRRHSRRRLLQGSLALAGFSLLSGCEKGPKVRTQLMELGQQLADAKASLNGGAKARR